MLPPGGATSNGGAIGIFSASAPTTFCSIARSTSLTASARVGATQTGQVFASTLLEHYRETLREIQQIGYATYAGRQFRPYLRAAAAQFSPARPTLTQQAIEKVQSMRGR